MTDSRILEQSVEVVRRYTTPAPALLLEQSVEVVRTLTSASSSGTANLSLSRGGSRRSRTSARDRA